MTTNSESWDFAYTNRQRITIGNDGKPLPQEDVPGQHAVRKGKVLLLCFCFFVNDFLVRPLWEAYVVYPILLRHDVLDALGMSYAMNCCDGLEKCAFTPCRWCKQNDKLDRLSG